MINDIKTELNQIKSVLSKWPDAEYKNTNGQSIDSDQAFVEIESNLRRIMDSILKLPEADRIQLKDTIGSFKDMMEVRQKETETKLQDLRTQATLNKSSKNAMKAYGSSLQNSKENV